MGKGSGRRPGEGYQEGWARIFGKPKEKQEQNQKDKCRSLFQPSNKAKGGTLG